MWEVASHRVEAVRIDLSMQCIRYASVCVGLSTCSCPFVEHYLLAPPPGPDSLASALATRNFTSAQTAYLEMQGISDDDIFSPDGHQWSVGQAIVLSVETITTVGYGQLYVGTDDRVYIYMYALIGIR